MRGTVKDEEISVLREAVSLLDASGDPIERARAYADLGAALRRAERPVEAREPLRVAVDLAHRFGAPALEEQALAELRAAGARPRRRAVTGPGALTRSEQRIVELAAIGRLNREIAETLVVTLATVEYHLRNAYRKLGITSRKQLPRALAVSPRAVATNSNAGSALRWRSRPARAAAFARWETRSPSATSTLQP